MGYKVIVGKGRTVHTAEWDEISRTYGTACGSEFGGNGRGRRGIRSTVNKVRDTEEVGCKTCTRRTEGQAQDEAHAERVRIGRERHALYLAGRDREADALVLTPA